IPGAAFYDIDALSDHSNPLPHMLPPPAQFSRDAGALGIGDGDMIVVYDTSGLFSAARVWFAFKAMGHDKIAVLDGGLPAWKSASGALESGAASPKPAQFTARFHQAPVRGFADVKDALGKTQVLDARSAPRFEGTEPEPR